MNAQSQIAAAPTDQVEQLWKEGLFPAEIAARLDIEVDEVMALAAQRDLASKLSASEPSAGRTLNEWTAEKRARLTKLWNEGMPASRIAAEFGVSASRIYQLRVDFGLPKRRSGRRGDPRSANDGQRRFKSVLPSEKKTAPPKLRDCHPAIRNGSTIYGRSVIPASEMQRLLKSGENNRKIGRIATKGRWKGMPIYTLTLEERATCPRSCKAWSICYGNNMGQAERIHDDGWLTTKLYLEMVLLAIEHPQGFIVRLHVLGDFASVEYVRFWEDALALIPQLRIFGFTAHLPTSPIGRALVFLMSDHVDRVAMRWSGAGHALHCSEVITDEADAIGIVCPAQKDADRSCATCGLCWTSEHTISFLEH